MGQRTIILTLLLTLILVSCKKDKIDNKLLDFGKFSIEVPKNWKKGTVTSVKDNEFDFGQEGQIITDNNDTLYFHLGSFQNNLDEPPMFEVENGKVYVLNEKLSKHSRFYEYAGTVNSVDTTNLVRKFEWETINSKKAKIFKTKTAGHGRTGVCFDSLRTNGSGLERFQLNGKNLRPENERDLLKSIMTIKFKNK